MKRWAIALGAAAAGGGLAYGIAQYWFHPSTLLLLDTSREVAAALEARAAEGATALPSGIDELGRLLPELVAREADEEAVALFYPAVRRKGWQYDPLLLFTRSPHLDLYQRFPEHPSGGWAVRTNDLGFREDADVAGATPDFSVLVMGDSHTSGACANSESFANVLERDLRSSRPAKAVDVWNAGQGAYDPFNYMGAPRRFADLRPDALIVCVYGGNDFLGVLGLRRYLFRRGPHRKRPYDRKPILKTGDRAIPLLGQELDQVLHLLNNPEEQQVALTISCAILAEIQRQCDESGIALVVAYLPPPSAVQPQFFRDELIDTLEVTGADDGALELTTQLGRGLVEFLDARGIAFVDLSQVLRDDRVRLYWNDDLHLNVAGHERVAAALLPVVAGWIDE